MKKTPIKDILQELTKKREANILLLSKWSDEDLTGIAKSYREAQEIAYEENRFEAYKILEEKLSQVYRAEDLKFSFTDGASDWIHW